jgi:molecular chaperone HtpG
MVADRIEVTSRKAGSEEAFTWASEGTGEFTVAPAERETPGTDVVLHIKADAEEYLEPIRLETIVRKWADHVTLPITVARDGKDQTANEGTALWRKSKADVSEQNLKEFYRHLGHFFDEPWATLHWKAEGTLEYFCLLFIPGMKPFDVVEGDRESHVRLHVRRMFITDKADLLPHWLRFVSGVVDTEDLPLNVSREMLQTTPVLGRIRKALIGRVLSELRNRAKAPETKETDAKEDEARASGDYAAFWENFGAIVKEGLWEDAEHRNEILPLVRFHSSTQDGVVSLADYVARMQPGQDTIYYLTGDNIEAMKSSPQLEGFRAKGIEVLLMFDPIDNFWPERSDTFEGKKLVAVTQAAGEFGKDDSLPDISVLLSAMKEALGEDVADVRSTGRLTDSAVVLAADDKGPDLQVQRLMRRAGRAMMPSRPILEVNPRHKLIEGLILKQDDKDLVKNVAETLLDLARVQEGEPLKDASGFARRVSTLLAGSLAA